MCIVIRDRLAPIERIKLVADVHIGPDEWSLQFGQADLAHVDIFDEREDGDIAGGEDRHLKAQLGSEWVK
jgi:hypothetical protein